MVVVLVISKLEYGGAQRQVIELANAMDPEKYDVHVCSLDSYNPLENLLDRKNGRFHVIQKKAKFDITVATRLAALLRELEADVVHGYLFDAEVAARLAGWLARTPVVVGSERNLNYTLQKRHLVPYWLTRKLMDVCIANSNAGAEFNSKLLGYPISKYRVVHNGVNTDLFTPREASAVRAEIGVPQESFCVGMFGSFKQQKNHPMLFRAVARLLDACPDLRVLLVGGQLHSGWGGSDAYHQLVGNLVEELGIEDRCIFLGNRNDVENIYNACDITVLPSLFEGTPNVALESMACGVPVVVTDVSDNALLVPDGEVGFVVPSEDDEALAARIMSFYQDREMLARMKLAARQWVESEYSVEQLAARSASVYLEALGQAGGREPGYSKV